MSFNPARAAGKDLRRKNRVRNPHAGIKQSTILAKQGSKMVLTSESQKRESTASGWKITEFKGKTFEVVFYYICARNSTGIIKNEKYDRSIRVLAGHVYLTTTGHTPTSNLKAMVTGWDLAESESDQGAPAPEQGANQ